MKILLDISLENFYTHKIIVKPLTTNSKYLKVCQECGLKFFYYSNGDIGLYNKDLIGLYNQYLNENLSCEEVMIRNIIK